jgi:large subunit ribosomal protein L1
MQRSKTYRAASETFDKNEIYAPLAAIKIAKDTSKKKFDETVDVVMRLGVDPRKADQMVRGTVNLPHGTGKTARVLVFANARRPRRPARPAPTRRWRRAHRQGRRWLARLRRRRRDPRHDGQGRSPRSRAGPAWPDAEPEDRHRDDGCGQGRVRHQGRQDRVPRRQARQPALHHRQGVLQPRKQLAENYAAAARRGAAVQAASSKGRYIKKITVSTTMGPGIQVDPNRTDAERSPKAPGRVRGLSPWSRPAAPTYALLSGRCRFRPASIWSEPLRARTSRFSKPETAGQPVPTCVSRSLCHTCEEPETAGRRSSGINPA